MTHGHLANVRMGLTTLALQAEEAGATIALFGHTHVLGADTITFSLLIREVFVYLVDQFKRKHMP